MTWYTDFIMILIIICFLYRSVDALKAEKTSAGKEVKGRKQTARGMHYLKLNAWLAICDVWKYFVLSQNTERKMV